MSIVANFHNARPLTAKPAVDHEQLIADLDAFNRAALELAREADELRPQSEAISKHGELLEKVLAAGTKHLTAEERELYAKAVAEFEAFLLKHFKPKYEKLLHKQAEQNLREKALKAKAKALNVVIDFHLLQPLQNN